MGTYMWIKGKVGVSGQVVIPKPFRESSGFKLDTDVIIEEKINKKGQKYLIVIKDEEFLEEEVREE